MNRQAEWLPTPMATKALGYSARTLKRYRDRNGGFLIAGQDWCFGPTGASSIRWNITTCRQKFHERGRLIYASDYLEEVAEEINAAIKLPVKFKAANGCRVELEIDSTEQQ